MADKSTSQNWIIWGHVSIEIKDNFVILGPMYCLDSLVSWSLVPLLYKIFESTYEGFINYLDQVAMQEIPVHLYFFQLF